MFERPGPRVQQQLKLLSQRLGEENPALEGVVDAFRALDRIGYAAGLLDPAEDSYAFSISWWPMIAVLGTFSAGKSTFINEYLGKTVQRSGSQAVDDRFTVISYGPSDTVVELPGLALDGDPRFPFYRVSDEIDRLSSGAGRTVDHFLAMKTVRSEPLRGRILIDSPGFDADEQRATILQLTDHIIDLSDLVIVFFDARHPEPGAMRDTLEHLVSRVAARNDFTKLIFVLNQIDTTWREDNLEEVVSAWQRAVARKGSATGRFYVMFNEGVAVDIADVRVRERYMEKASRDRAAIHARIDEITSSRSYRIVGAMQAIAESLEKDVTPVLTEALNRWKRRVLQFDLLTMGLFLALLVYVAELLGGGVSGFVDGSLWQSAHDNPWGVGLIGFAVFLILLALHVFNRSWLARRIASRLAKEGVGGNLREAFLKNTVIWRSIFRARPAGLGRTAMRQLQALREKTEAYVQRLNNQFMETGMPTQVPRVGADDSRMSIPSENPEGPR